MICCREIDEYLNYYEQCPNVFNYERKLLIENIVKPTLERDDIVFDEDMYQKCLKFCETWFYELFPYQKFVTAFIFMYDTDDMPLFRTFLIMVGRGNGKDGWIIPVALFLTSELYGINYYDIDIIANSEDQSKGSYDVVLQMFEQNKQKMLRHFYWNKEECYNRVTRSKMRYLTSSSKTGDGKKPGCLILNEYHAYEKIDKVNTGQGGLGKKRHPRIFIITSNGLVREGPLDELLIVCMDILLGEGNELRYFPFICKLDSKDLVDNPDNWIMANPSIEYMPTLKNTIMTDYLEMKKFPSKKADFMAKRMNLPEVEDIALVTSRENIMKACFSDDDHKIERTIPEMNNKKAIIGLDYASLNDFASVGILFKKDSEFIWRHHSWICSKSKYFSEIKFPFNLAGEKGYDDFTVIDAPSISEDLLIDWIMDMISKYNIQKIKLDNYKYQLMKNAFEKRGLIIESKENPEGIVSLIRYPASIAALVGPTLEVLFSEGNLNLGNSALMRWAINNTYMKDKKDGNKYFEKVEPKRRKNDPFMALVCAISAKDLLNEYVIYV